MIGRFAQAAALAIVCTACATAGEPAKASAAPQATTFERLPAGFARGDANAPIGLLVAVDAAGTVTNRPAGTGEKADVVLVRKAMGEGTSVNITNSTSAMLKYDLYISPDGVRFQYTSSCPLPAGGGGYEMWPYPIHSFAIGNLRVADADGMACR